MKMPLRLLLYASFVSFALVPCAEGQARLLTATVAPGGGGVAAGGTASVALTIGQAAAGSASGGAFSTSLGFPAQVIAAAAVVTDTEPAGPDAEVPADFRLEQNHPNPFNPVTVIRYALPRSAQVSLVVYDVLGRQVEALVEGPQRAGQHEAHWVAGDHSSGVYLYVLRAGSYVETRRMVLLK